MSSATYARHAEAIDHLRKTLAIHNSHVTLSNCNTGEIHVLNYDSEQPEEADVHFEHDCPGPECPRYYRRG